MKLKDRPFLIVEFTQRPKANVNTSIKGWMTNPANLDTFELVSVVDRIGSKQMRAGVIIDLVEGKVIKKNGMKPDDELVSHYIGKYEETIKNALRVWAYKQITDGKGNLTETPAAPVEEAE